MSSKIVHAYRRTKNHHVDVAGLKLKFEPNEAGEVVCDVPEGPALTRLLEIPEAYRLHGADTPKVPDEDDEDDDAGSPFVITVEGEGGQEQTVDLRKLDEAQLREFAKQNDIEIHPNAKKLDKMMDTIIKGLAAAD